MMRKTLIVIGIVLVLFAIGVWLFLSNIDSVAKSAIEKYGKEVTGVAVNVGDVHISPKTGEGKLHNLVIANPAGFTMPYAYSFSDALIKLDINSLATKLFIINELSMIAPEINVEQNTAGNNLHLIQENIKAFLAAHAADLNANNNRFIIDSFTVTNAKLHVSAPLIQADLITIPLADINMLNIGKDTGGMTAAEVLNIVMHQMNIEIVQAIKSRGLENTIDVHTLVPESASITDRIRNFFAR